ncbi:unnamed protein product [Mucor hiemalis]
MYIRAKREKTILFLCIAPKLTVDQIKTKLCEALDNGKTKDDVRLLVEGKKEGEYTLLESAKFLENSDVVYFVYLNQGQWETVNVVEPVLLDEDEMEQEELPAAKKEKGKGRA